MTFICPNCFSQKKEEVFLKQAAFGYLCPTCEKLFPLKPVVYLVNAKCKPQKCRLVCQKSCPQNAFKKSLIGEKGSFMLHNLLESIKNPRIQIKENCNNCGRCVKKCPLGALTSVDVPIFSELAEQIASPTNNKAKAPKKNLAILKPVPNKNNLRPASFFLYQLIIQRINQYQNKQIVDNGCGSNLIKAFVLSDKKNNKNKFFSLDIHLNRNPFSPLDALANSEQLPLATKSVDIFISVNVLEHITNPSNYLLEMYRTLKDDGEIILAVPTPWWHLSKFLSVHHHLNYLLHVLKHPLLFIKNPLKNFDLFWAHEKDCNHEDAKNNSTLSDELKKFRTDRWEALFKKCGLGVDQQLGAGNVWSNNIVFGGLTRKLGHSKNHPIFSVYFLKKLLPKK